MKIISEFEVNKFEEASLKNPEWLLESKKRAAAAELGQKILEMFPYQKDEKNSWPEGKPVLEMPYGIGPSPIDRYKTAFVILGRPDWENLRNTITHLFIDVASGRSSFSQASQEMLQAIEYYCDPKNP